jgi:23S rRNA pseudouridine2605 synthase
MAASRYPRGRVALERALSKLGLASRRDAQRLITTGMVTVNGQLVTDPLAGASPERDAIVVAGVAAVPLAWRTIAFHKPRGCVTTRRDPAGRTTVFDILGDAGRGLVAVGRLDLATTGLLLLTTDTQLAERLTNPSNAVVRRYVVTVRGEIAAASCAALEAGIGGMRAASVTVRKRSRRETHLIVELTEGRNREVRRLFQAVGHEVTRLLRVAYGPIQLGTLRPGAWREISAAEFSDR